MDQLLGYLDALSPLVGEGLRGYAVKKLQKLIPEAEAYISGTKPLSKGDAIDLSKRIKSDSQGAIHDALMAEKGQGGGRLESEWAENLLWANKSEKNLKKYLPLAEADGDSPLTVAAIKMTLGAFELSSKIKVMAEQQHTAKVEMKQEAKDAAERAQVAFFRTNVGQQLVDAIEAERPKIRKEWLDTKVHQLEQIAKTGVMPKHGDYGYGLREYLRYDNDKNIRIVSSIVEKNASLYADSVTSALMRKLYQKAGGMTDIVATGVRWPNFTITGKVGEKSVTISQQVIVNRRDYNYFNQFPATIRVDGRIVSEAEYYNMQKAGGYEAPASEPVQAADPEKARQIAELAEKLKVEKMAINRIRLTAQLAKLIGRGDE